MYPILAKFLKSDFSKFEEDTSRSFANFDNPQFDISEDCILMNPKKRKKLDHNTNKMFLIQSGVNYADCQHINCKYSHCNLMKCHPWSQRVQFLRQFGFSDSLEVFASNVQGWGVRTNSFIAKEKIIIEYTGERIDSGEKSQRELKEMEARPNEFTARNRMTPSPETYIMKIKRNSYIDSGTTGNISKYINHSCKPNCVSNFIIVEGKTIVIVSAKRNIQAGEELTYDYKIYGRETKCQCNEKRCRGFI